MAAPTEEFPPLKNDLILRAARGQKVERVPVWIMRQAGRYLPEFQAVRKNHDFFEICQTPSLACEITLQPIQRFPLDAAIIFSDILVIPQAFGMTVEMKPSVGPVFPNPLQHPDDLSKLEWPVDVNQKLGYVFEAITLTRKTLDGRVPLIGFSGAPWTLMSYMIEGGGSKTMSKSKAWLYRHRNDSHKLLQMLTDVIVDYLVGQVVAGAQMLQVFESHAEILGPATFNEYALPYLKQISERVKTQLRDDIPMVVFAKGGHYALKDLSRIGYDVIGLDWTMDPTLSRLDTGPDVTLQGNLDPCALYADKTELEVHVKSMLGKFGTRSYIANLGHGIYPDVPYENVGQFLEIVKRISSEMSSNS